MYARTSKIFILYQTDDQIFETDDGDTLLSALNIYLRLYMNKSTSNASKLKNNVHNLLKSLNKALLNVYSEVTHDSIIDSTRNLNPNELDLVLSLVSFFEFYLHSDLYNSQEIIANIKNCFS